ncbi:HAD family hydrolase [Streptomyces boncukensis]|uniref:HAD family hydrolase n=1 Tax=Streptomyces boncukensis TaxID=2711219 RepID=A0A6G4WXI1_9ACTN|nr:HAD family hydrolase [Streptomyces boncukensis]NGO69945.1 HAD family hydrolase [Streptomyces boncukensis]
MGGTVGTAGAAGTAGTAGVRGVIFDFYGTLVRMVPPWPPSHRSVLLRRGLAGAAGQWGDQWAVGPADGEEHTAHSGSEEAYHAWELARLRRRALACGVPEGEADGLAAELDRATKGFHLELYDDAAGTLSALRERGLTVGVCSNWFWHLDRAVAEVGLAGLVDAAVTSARAGARKPHPRVYRAALDACGLRPEQALFVGDMWEADVLGPLAAGMRAVHLCRAERAVRGATPALPAGAVRVGTLRDVGSLV